jgi:type II secretory pathway component PulF
MPFIWLWYTTESQRRGLLRLIAVAIEEKLPLVPLLEAWTADERGIQHYRLRRVVELLKTGTPLADALEQVPGVLRDDDILAIRFDAQSGTVTTAVREMLGDSGDAQPELHTRFRSTLAYMGIVLLLGLPVVVFIQIRIMPALRAIFYEYGLQFPAVTEWSIKLALIFERYGWLVILVAIIALLSLLFARPGRAIRRAAGRYLGPWRQLRTADLLRKLAIAVGAGRPISGALSTLARYHFDSAIRNKLLFVRNELEQGADLWQSMNDVDLMTRTEVRVMNLAEQVDNRSWALRQLAYAKSLRATRFLERFSQIALPALVLCVGLFVLLQVLSIFVPVTEMVTRLAA